MDIKKMRNVHLYLGVFFTPLLFLFIVTGCWQSFDLHEASKSRPAYQPPEIVKSFSEVHTHQRWTEGEIRPAASKPFRYLIVLMSVGLLITTALGVVMAFKYTRPIIVWGCLAAGILIPCFLLGIAFLVRP